MGSYDRDKAIAYAQTYWTIPCADGLMGAAYGHPSIAHFRHTLHAPASDWQALFVREGGTERGVFQKPGEEDKVFQAWRGLDDCAHYVSQCLRAGGASIDTQWGARELKEDLQNQRNTKTLAERASLKAGQRIVDAGLLKEGDAIIYYNTDPSDESPIGYHHSAMYVGNGGITCHSVCRYKGRGDSTDDEWHLNSGAALQYTLIHLSSDDTTVPGAGEALAGWWKVEYPGRVSYYSVLSSGLIHQSQIAPRRVTEHAPQTPSAYWFQNGNTIRFVWKETGDFEEWTTGGTGDSVDVAKQNGALGKATKLFQSEPQSPQR